MRRLFYFFVFRKFFLRKRWAIFFFPRAKGSISDAGYLCLKHFWRFLVPSFLAQRTLLATQTTSV